MDSKRFLIVAATSLVLFAVILEAKSVRDGQRHKTKASRETTLEHDGEELTEQSLPSKRHARKENELSRKRRGFARWNIPQDDYDRFSMWKPPVYSISRPYYIPVYGPAGQIPIFFPPQPFNINIGVPPDNPIIPFMGPHYLPPETPTIRPPTTTTMKINNRFPDLEDDDEPRPIWGNVKTTTTRRPRPQQPQNGVPSGSVVPTRPPRPKSTTETPPLVHQINGGKIPLNAIDESQETAAAIDTIFAKPEEFNPPPPSFQRPVQAFPTRTTSTPIRTTTATPFTSSPQRTTTAPSRTTTRRVEPAGPSNCVWAVVSCCSAASTKVAEACFEQRGCPGPFWDRSPCDSDFAKAAINTALEYYGK